MAIILLLNKQLFEEEATGMDKVSVHLTQLFRSELGEFTSKHNHFAENRTKIWRKNSSSIS